MIASDIELTPALEGELVQRTARGDGEAFEKLMARYYRAVGSFILKRVRQGDAVEDLVQETFLEAFRSLRQGRVPDRFSTWLFGIAHNLSGKWLRRGRILSFRGPPPEELVASDPPPGLEEIEEQQKLQERLERGVNELPKDIQQMLAWKHREGQTCEQIAENTGRPVGTIKSLLSRAYQGLRRWLAPEGA